MKLKSKYNIKAVINIIAAILLIAVVIICLVKNMELKTKNDRLNADISAQEGVVKNLSVDNENLSGKIAQLNADISQLNNTNNKLREDNESYELQVQEMLNEIEKLEKEILQIKNNNSTSSHKDFKSYMPYQAITNRYSKQWELQQYATTNEDGIRCIDGVPMIAIGTGWGLWVGDIVTVTCENGNSFKAIVGDIKDDSHTDTENKTTVANGCRCEFIVDIAKIDPTAKIMGNMATLDKYKGYVVNVEKAV